MSYYSSGLLTQDGELLNGPASLANGVLVCNADGSSVISSIDSILGFTPANDAQVVHLAGTETITGAKTFDSRVSFGTNGYQISNGSADNYWKVDYVPTNSLSWKSASGVNNTMKLSSNGRITLAGSDAGISFGQYSYNSADSSIVRDSAGTLKVGSTGDGTLKSYLEVNEAGHVELASDTLVPTQITASSQRLFVKPDSTNNKLMLDNVGKQMMLASDYGLSWGNSVAATTGTTDTYLKRNSPGSVGIYQSDGTTAGTLQAAIVRNSTASGHVTLQGAGYVYLYAFDTYVAYVTDSGIRPANDGVQELGSNTRHWGAAYTNLVRNAVGTLDVSGVGGLDFLTDDTSRMQINSSGQVLVDSSVSHHVSNKLSIDSNDRKAFSIGDVNLTRYASFGYANAVNIWYPASARSICFIEGTNLRGFEFNQPVGINSKTYDETTLLIGGTTGQTANLTEWQDSSGAALSYVDSIGALNTDKIADINGQLIVESDDIYFQIPGNTRGPRITVNTTGSTVTWSGSKAGSGAFHTIAAAGGQANDYPVLQVEGLGSSVSNQIQRWVRRSDSSLQAYVTSDGLFQGNTGFTAGNGTSSDSGGLQMATTGGNHAVDVQGNIQYVESYNKTIIRRGSDAVFDSNGAGGVIATAVATLPRGVYVTPASASLQAMVVRAKASQTENIVEFQDSTGTITNQWDSAGSLTTPSGMVIQGLSNSTENMLQMLKENGSQVFKFSATGGGSCKINGDGEFGIETESTTGILKLGQVNNRTMVYINSTENVGIGYGVGTSPEGTLEVQDQLGLGTTLVNITAGPTQTTNLTQWRDNSDTVLAFVDDSGNSSFTGNAYRSGVIDPTTIDLDDGYETTWKNTTTGEVEHWVNTSGVMKKLQHHVGDLNVIWPNTTDEFYYRYSGGGTVASNTRICFTPFTVTKDCTLDSVSCRVKTAASGDTLGVSVYRTGPNGLPKTLDTDCGSLSADTTGVKTISGLNISFKAGELFWIGTIGQTSTTSEWFGQSGSTSNPNYRGGVAGGGRGSMGDNLSRNGVYGYNTATPGVFDSSVTPILGLGSATDAVNVEITFSSAG